MTDAARPAVRIVRGAPDDVELAALVAGLAAAQPHLEDEAATQPHRWADHGRSLRGPETWRPGTDAWRWSLRG